MVALFLVWQGWLMWTKWAIILRPTIRINSDVSYMYNVLVVVVVFAVGCYCLLLVVIVWCLMFDVLIINRQVFSRNYRWSFQVKRFHVSYYVLNVFVRGVCIWIWTYAKYMWVYVNKQICEYMYAVICIHVFNIRI